MLSLRIREETRIIKNSSKFEAEIAKNFNLSIMGFVLSCASSSTRSLNSSQLNSRLAYRVGSVKFTDTELLVFDVVGFTGVELLIFDGVRFTNVKSSIFWPP